MYFLQRKGQALPAIRVMLASLAAFVAVVIFAQPAIARPSTRELARIVNQQIRPGDLVLHYHDYFHDFSYYSHQIVGTVAFKGELELAFEPDATRLTAHVDEEQFRRLWDSPRTIYLVLRRRELAPLLQQPGFTARLVVETPNHVVLVNRGAHAPDAAALKSSEQVRFEWEKSARKWPVNIESDLVFAAAIIRNPRALRSR